MGTYFKAIDRFAAGLARTVTGRRWLVISLSLLLAVAAGAGAGKLEFSTNYRVFFSDSNPELNAFEDLQNTYTKNDNIFFVVEPADGRVFDAGTLGAIAGGALGHLRARRGNGGGGFLHGALGRGEEG